MKKVKCFLTLFILLFLNISCVYGEVSSNDIEAKYTSGKDSNFYEGVFENNNVSINTLGLGITIETSSTNDNGLRCVLVNVKDEAYTWLNSIAGKDNTNMLGYYLTFYNQDTSVAPSGKITIHISNITGYSRPVVKTVNVGGSVISTTRISTSGKMTITADGKTYFTLGQYNAYGIPDNVPVQDAALYIKEIVNGSIVIDENTYTGNYTYKKTKGSKVDIIILPNQGYKVNSVIFDGKDITSIAEGGFVTIELLNENQSITVTFTKQEEQIDGKLYSISGILTKGGVPVSGATVELHSFVKTYVTKPDGYYEFENVEEGPHTMKVSLDNKVIGYTEFEINGNNTNSEVSTSKVNGRLEISAKDKVQNLKLDLNVDDSSRIEIKDIKVIVATEPDIVVEKEEKSNMSNIIWIVIIAIVIVIILVIIIKKRRK